MCKPAIFNITLGQCISISETRDGFQKKLLVFLILKLVIKIKILSKPDCTQNGEKLQRRKAPQFFSILSAMGGKQIVFKKIVMKMK